MAYYPFVADFRGHLRNFFSRNKNKRGFAKKAGGYKPYRYRSTKPGRRPQTTYYASYSGYKKAKNKDDLYRDTSIVDAKGYTTRIPWWAD